MINETTIRAAIAAPVLFADDLAEVMNDRGARDAALVITSRTGEWDRLCIAATIAGSAAHASGASMAGPLVTYAAASWVKEGLDEELQGLLASVPRTDPAHRMAELLLRLNRRGIPGQVWADRMADLDVVTCIAFRGSESTAA